MNIHCLLPLTVFMNIHTCLPFPAGPPMMSLLIDRHPTDLKAYNIRHNTSDSYVRGILKDLRNRYIDRIILLCSSTNTNIVLTQVEQTFLYAHE